MRKLRLNHVVAGIIFLLSGACLVITTMMTRQSGASQAATQQGAMLLGYASIAIHLGLPTFGIASGWLRRDGQRWAAAGCMLLVFLCATFSINNVMTFVATERISLSKANADAAKSKQDREKAAIEAAKKQQDMVNKMAESNLKWLQGTAKEADGRKERKDTMESASAFIKDFAKQEVAKAPATETGPVVMRTDAGVEMIAEFTGWSANVLQLSNVIQIVIMMIIFESFGWTVGSNVMFTGSGKALATVPSHPATPLPVDGGNHGKQRLLSAPSRSDPKMITVRTEPTAEWRKLLDAVDFPAAGGRFKGPERPRLEPSQQALRFMVWLGAYNERGRWHNTELDALYTEFLNADHRVETALRQVKPELEAIGRGKFASKKAVQGEGTVWNVEPPPLERMQQLLEKAGMVKPEPFTVTQVAALPEVKTGESKSSSIIPFWRSRTAGGGLH